MKQATRSRGSGCASREARPSCVDCGRPLGAEEAAYPQKGEAGEIICDECYSDHHEYLCPLCQNLVAIAGNQEHIIVTPALADDQRMKPGIYRITAWPWFSSNYFSIRIRQNALTREANLPDIASNMDCGNYVCEQCVPGMSTGVRT